MGYKIENITATIPCKGIQYCDLRPQVSADSIEEYREALAEIGRLANNPDFVERMTGETLTASTSQKITSNGVTLSFDPAAHTYSENGKPYLTGSTFASMFEEPFKADIIAPKVAEKKLTTTDKVLASWELKNQVSCDYGTAVHKSVEMAIKYNEMPNNPHLAALARDAIDLFTDIDAKDLAPEQFVCDPTHRLCGTIDLLVNYGDKMVEIIDWKTSDIDKKVTFTKQAKSFWPDLPAKLSSIYALQLSFYAYILEQQGYKVHALHLMAETAGTWKRYTVPKLDIKEALEAVWQ